MPTWLLVYAAATKIYWHSYETSGAMVGDSFAYAYKDQCTEKNGNFYREVKYWNNLSPLVPEGNIKMSSSTNRWN